MTTISPNTALNQSASVIGLSEMWPRLEIAESTVHAVRADDVEEPSKSVLVHPYDMTPTLEKLIDHSIGIQVLWREMSPDSVTRQVLLSPSGIRSRPLVLGHIKIMMLNLPSRVRTLVQSETMPFGTILRQERVVHSNTPSQFFYLRLNTRLAKYFSCESGRIAYGRYREMVSDKNITLAQVLEIVSPEIVLS